jgi:N-acetylglutamate synthase-like GNAT family acetyltransferase
MAVPDLILVRPAWLEEQQALEELQKRSADADETYRKALAAHPYEFTVPLQQILDGQVFVAEFGGAVAGFASVIFRHDGGIEIDGLFVEPGVWRRGVGRALVARCVLFARDVGVSSLHVIASPVSAGFYSKVGFETLGPYETEFASAVSMRRGVPARGG